MKKIFESVALKNIALKNRLIEALVKKLIEKITVFADHFTVEFKSGITIDIEA